MTEKYGIEKIAKEHDFVLFDSTALIDPFCNRKNNEGHDEITKCINTKNLHKKIDYIVFLQDCLRERYPFYLTKKIMNEVNKDGNYARDYKRHLKNSGHFKGSVFFVSPKTIEKETSEFNRLISLFSNKGRIVQLTDYEKKLYSRFSFDFSYLKDLKNLNDTNFDFLLSGMVLSNTRGRTAILTNNSKIRRARFHLIKKHVFNPDYFVLFWCLGSESFYKSEDFID